MRNMPRQIGVRLLFSLLMALVVAMPRQVAGQSQTDGSIYSRFGLGDRISFFSGRSQAMGGGGLALSSLNYGNHSNPATFADLFFTRMTAAMTFEDLTEIDDSDGKSKLTSGYLNAIQMAFPLKASRLGLGISFAPYSRVNYRVDTGGIVDIDPETGTQESYVTSFKGNGGLQQLSAGLGYKIGNNFRIGASADFIFGIIEETQKTVFTNPTIAQSNVVKSTRLSGLAFTGGIRYATTGVFTEDDGISFAATATVPSRLSGDRVLTLGDPQTADTLSAGSHGTVDLPLAVSVGLAYQPNRRWTFIVDALFEQWSSFKSDFTFPGYEDVNSNSLGDRKRLSAGAEFSPGSSNLFATFFQSLAFRLGVYLDESYVSPDPETRINSVGVTGGLSIPTLIPGTRIDINMDVGRRGTTDNGLIRDSYLRLGINLNFGERWFNRRKLG